MGGKRKGRVVRHEVYVVEMLIGTVHCMSTLSCFQQGATREGLLASLGRAVHNSTNTA
jgi:hypothetical protein